MASTVDLRVATHSSRYDVEDDRWQEQVADLVHDLRVNTGALRMVPTPVSGTKGAVIDVVLTVDSASVISAALELMRLWLGRDKTRSILLRYQDADGSDHEVSVVATNADSHALAPVIEAVALQVAERA